MGLIDFNFNFGKKDKLKEIDNQSFETTKFRAKIAVIDDEEFPHMELLTDEGYNVTNFTDIKNIETFISKNYDVLILDIQGVGREIAGSEEGWGVLEYLKRIHPHLVVVVFTGADWSITKYKEKSDLADYIIGKDSEYLTFKMKLDAAIRKALSYDYHIKIFKKELQNLGFESKAVEDIIKKYGHNKEKTKSKILKKFDGEKAIKVTDDLLGVLSSIQSLLS